MRTKIIATIGPASSSAEVLHQLVEAGVRIFRLNFSHGDSASFVDLIARIRQLETIFDCPLTILQDLSGPKIRIGMLKGGNTLSLDKGDHALLGSTDTPSQELTFPLLPFDHAAVLSELTIGDRLVLSDGGLQFRIVDKKHDALFELEALNSGLVTSRKGLALPGKSMRLPALTEKDKKDLHDGLLLGVDAVAISYVQTPEDILDAKAIINASGRCIPVVAKLERQNAVDRLDDILAVTDIVMVARGDLGVECPLPLLPAMQKRIIRACNRLNKPVIVATQMLLSMVQSPSPTRAETTDVANAVLDGADCVMLSEETAMGNFPVETVNFMQDITTKAEEYLFETRTLKAPAENAPPADFLAYTACLLANKANAAAIVSHSMSGSSARMIASRKPEQFIYTITPDEFTLRALNFSWGVLPYRANMQQSGHLARAEHFVDTSPRFVAGDTVVITAGQPKAGDHARGTNLVKIYRK